MVHTESPSAPLRQLALHNNKRGRQIARFLLCTSALPPKNTGSGEGLNTTKTRRRNIGIVLSWRIGAVVLRRLWRLLARSSICIMVPPTHNKEKKQKLSWGCHLGAIGAINRKKTRVRWCYHFFWRNHCSLKRRTISSWN